MNTPQKAKAIAKRILGRGPIVAALAGAPASKTINLLKPREAQSRERA